MGIGMKDDIYPIWRDVDEHMDMPDGVDMKHNINVPLDQMNLMLL